MKIQKLAVLCILLCLLLSLIHIYSVEKSKILVGEAHADDSFIEYSNIYNFAEIYQIDGKKIKDIILDCIVTWRNV